MEQTFSPRHILVVFKHENAAATALAGTLVHWLRQRGYEARMLRGDAPHEALRRPGTAGAAGVPAATDAAGALTSTASENACKNRDWTPDLAVVLGGDGTMLGVARAFVEQPVPLVGLNFGKVGFLAELHANDWENGLSSVLEGRCRILRRMALGWRVWRGGERMGSGVAVNDVVISRGSLSRVISLDVSVEDQRVCRVRADGLILSTPTGASGYAVSAGGPLVHPDIDALTLTPICPFLCNFPPMVLPCPMRVRAEVCSESVDTFLTSDGQESAPLTHGDVVEVFGMPGCVHYARSGSGTYFRRLKGRGFIEEYPGASPQRS